MSELSTGSALLSNHLALVRQVLQEPSDNRSGHSPYSQATGTAGGNERGDVQVSLSASGRETNSGTGSGNAHTFQQQERTNLSATPRSGSQKLLEAMIDAMSGETEFDQTGKIINTYV